MRATWASPSSGSTPTSASRPGPIAPTISSSTRTLASVTRWIRASMRGPVQGVRTMLWAARGPVNRRPSSGGD